MFQTAVDESKKWRYKKRSFYLPLRYLEMGIKLAQHLGDAN
jgi:hypothetical protein